MTAPASTPSLLVADEEAALLRAENTAINMDGGRFNSISYRIVSCGSL